jgi:hypothetical protein
MSNGLETKQPSSMQVKANLSANNLKWTNITDISPIDTTLSYNQLPLMTLTSTFLLPLLHGTVSDTPSFPPATRNRLPEFH